MSWRKRPRVGGPRIDYSVLAIPKIRSIAAEKAETDSAFEKQLREAYRQVEIRDENRSRVTGVVLFASSGNERRQREHNHLGRRSTYPSLKTAVKNIFLCSTYEHRFLTNNELLTHGTDANKDLRFYWNPRVFKPGMTVPFRIPAAHRYDPRKAATAA